METHKAFRIARAQRMFAKLMDLSAEQEQMLRDDPSPFLHRACGEVYHARKTLRDVKAALLGLDVMVMAGPPQLSRSIELEQHLRIQKALTLLREVTK